MPHPPTERASKDARAIIDRMKRVSQTKTDAQLAAELGLTKGAIPNWRKRGVPIQYIARFADKWSVSIEWLRSGTTDTGQVELVVREARHYQAQQKVLGIEIGIDEAVRAIAKDPGTVYTLSPMSMAFALVEAEQEYLAEHPGEDFRASQLAERAARAYRRFEYMFNNTRLSREEMAHSIKGGLGLPPDWSPGDGW